MGGNKNKAGGQKGGRTKGNTKPSSSEKSANFLVQKTGSLGSGTGFGDLSPGLVGDAANTGTGGLSFGRLAAYVPIDHDPDAANIDPDIRMQLRKMDKRDAVTKQKALTELIPLLAPEQESDSSGEEGGVYGKSEAAVLSALPYWPRIYARLAMDEDRKVRELTQRVLAGFTVRAGRNLAPHLKQLLPHWVMSQCDLFEPAAIVAEQCFLATFPAHKQKNAFLHCWSEIFSQIEDTLNTENPPSIGTKEDDNSGESLESRYARTIMACLRTLAKLLPSLTDIEEAQERLTILLKSKPFWRHMKPNLAVVNAAYYHLITTTCREFPSVAQMCCVQLCEATLRHVDEDSPVTVAALWEALLSVLQGVEQVWKFVSFKKSFSPRLITVLQEGGGGCARTIYPNMLPLFSKLPLSILVREEAKTLIHLLGKMNEGLHKERVLISPADSNAIASALFECSRFLVSEALKGEDMEAARELLEDIVIPVIYECLHKPQSRAFADTVFSQTSRLIQYLQKTSPNLSQVVKSHLMNWISKHGQEIHFSTSLLSFVFFFTDSTMAVNSARKQVSFPSEISEEPCNDTILVLGEENSWKIDWLLELRGLLEVTIVSGAPQCLMPYFCISSRLPDYATQKTNSGALNRTAILELCPTLLTEDVLTTRQVCRTIGAGIANILPDIPDYARKIRELFSYLSDSQAVLFLGKVFPWITHDAKSPEVRAMVIASLEMEITNWGHQLTENVFIKQVVDCEMRLRTLLNIVFRSTSSFSSSLLHLRSNFVQDVTRCMDNLETALSKSKRIFLADNLYYFLCLQEFDTEFESWIPLVLHLIKLYLQHLTFDARSEAQHKQLQETSDDEDTCTNSDAYIWTKVDCMIGQTFETLIEHREECGENMLNNFLECAWTCLLTSISRCKRKSGSNLQESVATRLLTILVDKAETEDIIRLLKLSFNFVDSALCEISRDVAVNNRFHCKLYYTDQENFSVLIRSTHFLLSLVTTAKFNVKQLIPEFWLPFVLVASMLDGSIQLESSDTVELYDTLRNYVLNSICLDMKEVVTNTLIDLCTGNYSQLQNMKKVSSYNNVILRFCLLFCIPNKPSLWPHGLQSKVTGLISDWPTCTNNEFSLTINVFIPAAACGRILVKESMVSLLQQTANNTDITFHTAQRTLDLIGTLIQLDSSYVISLLPIVVNLKEQHSLIVEEFEDLQGNDNKLDSTSAILWILYKSVQSSPMDITADQLDFVLCLASSLTSLITSDLKEVMFSSENEAVLSFHVLTLISAVGAALPCINMDSVLSEWNDFFSLHIFEVLLPLFVEMATRADITEDQRIGGFVSEALSSSLTVCPHQRLLENTLPPILFADDPVMLPVPIQSLINTLFPLIYSPRQSVQLGAFSILFRVAEDLAKFLAGKEGEEEETELNQIKLPLAITRNLSRLFSSTSSDSLQLLSKLTPATWGSTSLLIKQSGNHQVELSGFIFTWRLLLTIFKSASTETRAQLASLLLDQSHFSNLMECLYRMMPSNPVCSLREAANTIVVSTVSQSRLSTTTLSLIEDEPALLERITDYRSIFQLQHLACHVYRRCLQDAPAMARLWWLRQNKMVAAYCERYTERFVTPYLCRVQIEEVNKMAGELSSDAASVEIKGRPAAREVHAVYRMSDNHTIELTVAMPTNYPLGQVTVESGRKVGVTTQQWRAWLLQLTIFLQNQNGSILQGLEVWKMNLDKKFEGVEDCMICYSILHGTTFNLPRLQCRVCKKRFHYTCMYKWFTSSQNPTCPLCRNLFYDIPHAWKRLQTTQNHIEEEDYNY